MLYLWNVREVGGGRGPVGFGCGLHPGAAADRLRAPLAAQRRQCLTRRIREYACSARRPLLSPDM